MLNLNAPFFTMKLFSYIRVYEIMCLHDYAFTLRKTTTKKATPTEKVYQDHIERIFTKNGVNIIDYGFEEERGLHVHGVCQFTEKDLKTQKKFRIRGWRLHLTPIFDMKGWMTYYSKNKTHYEYRPTQEDLQELADYQSEFREHDDEPVELIIRPGIKSLFI